MGCLHSMVSIGPNDLWPSPRIAKGWRKKEINPFVSGTTDSACIIIIIIHLLELFTSALADVFHWSLSDSESPQVSTTLLSILAVLNNAVVWMVSTRPPTSKSSSPFSNPLVTVPNAPITIGIIVTYMFDSFFNSLARLRYLSFFSHSFSFILWSAGTAKSTILQVILFFCCWLLLSLVFWPGLGDLFVC